MNEGPILASAWDD